MMHVRRIENTVLSSNTFLLSDDSSDTCYLIDVGDVDKIVEALPSYGVVKGVFLTHTHFDHIYGINALYHIFPDITVYTSAYGKEAVYSAKKNLSFYHDMPLSFEGHDMRILAENDTIRLFPDTTLRVLETPGHCPSCLSYIVGQYMFTGDSYIPGKSVISKLPRGNKQLAQESEERIKAVCSQYLICPGHGEIVNLIKDMSNNKRIYLCLAHMSGEEQKYIKEAFDTNWVVPLGPNVNGFESDLETFVGEGKKVVALSSGTAAVHLALIACGVGAGDEVIVQDFTFCASSHPVTYLGATPVFVDSEKDSWNIDPDLLEKAIKDRIAKTGKKPKAIVPVALYGMPYCIDRIMEIADRYDIPVIEDAAEGFGSRYDGRVLGTFGRYGVLSFNGNKMITTSGGGALICPDEEAKNRIMWYATQAREAYPYYQHEAIGYNYRLSNICAGIGRGQMTVANDHIAHHKHVFELYRELFADISGIEVHGNPSERSDANFWLNTITIDPAIRIKGQENAYKKTIKGAVGGAAGVVHATEQAHTDCEPNANVEALRMALDAAGVEARPLWKPMHRQPVYKNNPAYVNGVAESLFKVGMCLPSGPYVTDDDVRYIVEQIKKNIR